MDWAVALHRETGPGPLETVHGAVLVELTSVEKVTKAHHKQVLTYPRLTGIGLRHLLNFGEALMRDGISPIMNGDGE